MLDAALQYLKDGRSVIPVKPDKKPYFTWTVYQYRLPTVAEVTDWWTRKPDAGIAIISGEISGVTVIDTDTHRVPGCDKPIEEALPNDGVAIQGTPRRGRHFIFAYTAALQQTQKANGIDVRNNGGYFLVCPTPGYEWEIPIEGLVLQPVPQKIIEMLSAALQHIQVAPGTTIIPQGERDDRLFHLANRLYRGGADTEEVRAHLRIFAGACDPPFPAKELEIKIESALKRDTARAGSLAQEVADWVRVTEGYFSVTDLDRELQLVTKGDKTNRKQILHRLVKDKVIERFPNKNGVFRRIITEYNVIDLTTLGDQLIEVKYPFEIERLVQTMPKNVIIVAGEPDSGKTSFLLNFAHMNMDRHTIRYLTSEMAGPELKARLSKFRTPPALWKVEFIERAGNFADLILPDAITLIDYLELTDNFFLVSGMIKEIFDKLNNGIAMIALQKNRGTDLGLGGYRSLEKARLYVAMSPGALKIVKAKNWADPTTNPNGLVQRFKLYQGADFYRQGEWHREAEVEKNI
jgi:hypothetical protein